MTPTIGFIYAHPDDETFLSACLIKQLVHEGEQPVLLLATKGDAGKKNGYVAHLSNEELAALRVQEMEQAAEILGLTVIEHLGHPDGKLNQVDETLFIEQVAEFINKYQLKVIFSFPEDGGNFHPDHMAISKMATLAVLSGKCPSVQKLYYCISNTLLQQGHEPSISVDTMPQWEIKAKALRAHASQILAIERYFGDLSLCPENRRYESFVLGWERGVLWPQKRELSVLDDLI
ncbi:PIG-L deacetylase family protein [Paenibacillus radicis (ex Xue et al. 2023)]|uniref:PIG-L family deacetylase n=1 Tax=Paenibacillus radicis (ex Xue et al. 2023) TaxID=2972489 RepID=A0ABT1YCN8_9BACL|nr:PIG-L deacetylase family protein [Paenibacillus radicis (ex Xue et al. 2023)]MCR8630530.1 PIG-L family deacetylase [Paenibacillus radicis (ex Xue et al. 2023)]